MCDQGRDSAGMVDRRHDISESAPPSNKMYYRTTSPLEEMSKRSATIQAERIMLDEGITFLHENPAFDKFIALIRKGAISI